MKCSEIGSLVEDSAFISPSIHMKPKKIRPSIGIHELQPQVQSLCRVAQLNGAHSERDSSVLCFQGPLPASWLQWVKTTVQ